MAAEIKFNPVASRQVLKNTCLTYANSPMTAERFSEWLGVPEWIGRSLIACGRSLHEEDADRHQHSSSASSGACLVARKLDDPRFYAGRARGLWVMDLRLARRFNIIGGALPPLPKGGEWFVVQPDQP